MPLTEAERKQLIVLEVGDNAALVLASSIDLLWTRYEAIDNLEVRELYTRRDAIDLMIGQVRAQVTIRGGDGSSVDLNKLFDHLVAMREKVETLLMSAQSSLSGGGQVGTIEKTAPYPPDSPFGVDANDRIYRGDALRRR